MLLRALAAAALALPLAAEGDDGYEGHGRAGWGARVVTPSLEVLAEHGLAPGEGVQVVRVRPGGTADTLGVQPGDVITELNGQPIAHRRDIRAVVRAAAPGDEVVVTLATPSGAARRLEGVFQQRPPRIPGPPPWVQAGQPPPWSAAGGPPPWAGDPAEVVARQQRQLLAEAADLAAARRDLASARARVPPSTAWSLTIDLAVGDAPLEDLP